MKGFRFNRIDVAIFSGLLSSHFLQSTVIMLRQGKIYYAGTACQAFLWSCLLFITSANAQTQAFTGKKPQVKLIYGALTAANGPIWLAADHGLFEKHGLDVQIVHGRGGFCPRRENSPLRLDWKIAALCPRDRPENRQGDTEPEESREPYGGDLGLGQRQRTDHRRQRERLAAILERYRKSLYPDNVRIDPAAVSRVAEAHKSAGLLASSVDYKPLLDLSIVGN
jgi:hypothetical protein